MAGEGTSLCPDCRILSVEGVGSDVLRWVAERGWVDVQSNSWGALTPNPIQGVAEDVPETTIPVPEETVEVPEPARGPSPVNNVSTGPVTVNGSDFQEDLEQAAQTHLTYFASGNGFAGFLGLTPWPTHVQPTLQESIVWVGAHDNGKVAHWQGTPPHVVADGYRGLAADARETSGVDATPFACCTSASAPYAAGLGARIVQEARTIVGDTGTGPDDGVIVSGEPAQVTVGPLADGNLTLDELRELVKHTAEPRPSEGPHDGQLHWLGQDATENRGGTAVEAAQQSSPWGPSGNPYCPGCVTLPFNWNEIPDGPPGEAPDVDEAPDEGPAYTVVGYGGATVENLETAIEVLRGNAQQPDRSDVDAYFTQQKPVRDAVSDPTP
jgi:hypothetical protein